MVVTNNMQGNQQPIPGTLPKGVLPHQAYQQQGIPMASNQGNPQYYQGYHSKQMMSQNNMPASAVPLHSAIQQTVQPVNQKQPTAILTNQNHLHKGSNLANQKQNQPTIVLQKSTTHPVVANQMTGQTQGHGGMTNQNQPQSVITNQNGTAANDSKEAPPLTTESTNEKGTGNNGSQLANTKEKTPMCLLNELARYNKVSHQYMLVDEQGPAHQKLFFVKLKLGEEEYSSSGQSIKKAQHAVAALALEKTTFPKPPPKPQREPGHVNSIMPTVELNAIAMRRGEVATYKPIEPRHSQYYQPNFDFRGMYNQRYRYPRPTRSAYVSLKVGQREFIGEGPTHQAARHMAATKALRILKNLPTPNPPSKPKEEQEENKTDASPEDELKSEISLVHEIGLKRSMTVNFEVIKESGPPHMKIFITRCIVGDKTTEGEGHSKKLSKKRSAELMLDELKKLPALTNGPPPPRNRPANTKKKNRNLIKLQKGDQTYGVSINPISRLIQITQAQKKKEPIFTLVGDHGVYHRREFVMQVQVDEEKCTGVGHNKKLAKRNAAETMLHHLGFNQSPPQPSKSSIKTNEGSGNGDKKVTFVETNTENGNNGVGIKNSCQLVPGLLLIPDSSRTSSHTSSTSTSYTQGSEDLNIGIGRGLGTSQSSLRPEARLRELAQLHKFEIVFDDFSAQNNKNEHLSRLTLGLNPPQIFHGSGSSIDASHDHAALTALQQLGKGVGVDATGDGPHVQTGGRASFNSSQSRKVQLSRVIKNEK